MDENLLETSQMLKMHPLQRENDSCKKKYLYLLEYFVHKYAENDIWATSTLRLYVDTLLGKDTDYEYYMSEITDSTKRLKDLALFKDDPAKFFKCRYCLLIDGIYICAFDNKEKGEQILNEILSLYDERHHKRIRLVFDSLYDPSIKPGNLGKANYLIKCWRKNKEFLQEEPIKVMVTACMSAGKSTLLNALIGRTVNKTQNDACTSKVHYIKNKAFEDELCYELDGPLNLDADYETLMDDSQNNESNNITVGTHFRSIEDTPHRIWLVDTPGVNFSQGEIHKNITEEAIRNVNVNLLICLINAETIGTDSVNDHLNFLHDNYHGNIIFVINKLDQFKKREDSVQKSIQKMEVNLTEKNQFINPVVVPVSAYAAYLAKMKIFNEPLDSDDEDEFSLMSHKLNRPEFQFDRYYPEKIQSAVKMTCDNESKTLLFHSGLLQLEQIINMTR